MIKKLIITGDVDIKILSINSIMTRKINILYKRLLIVKQVVISHPVFEKNNKKKKNVFISLKDV